MHEAKGQGNEHHKPKQKVNYVENYKIILIIEQLLTIATPTNYNNPNTARHIVMIALMSGLQHQYSKHRVSESNSMIVVYSELR